MSCFLYSSLAYPLLFFNSFAGVVAVQVLRFYPSLPPVPQPHCFSVFCHVVVKFRQIPEISGIRPRARLSHTHTQKVPMPRAATVVICSMHTSLSTLYHLFLYVCARKLISEYDGTHQSWSIPLCLLQKGPWSSFCAQESSVSHTHVKTWVSMMHQGDIQISFHPPRASSPLFIWLLGCSVNDISSTITLKCVQETDPPPWLSPLPPS